MIVILKPWIFIQVNCSTDQSETELMSRLLYTDFVFLFLELSDDLKQKLPQQGTRQRQGTYSIFALPNPFSSMKEMFKPKTTSPKPGHVVLGIHDCYNLRVLQLQVISPSPKNASWPKPVRLGKTNEVGLEIIRPLGFCNLSVQEHYDIFDKCTNI